jgi:LysR family hydrogen peroxide-inducible transcriptional activator
MLWRRSSAMSDFLEQLATLFKALPEALLSARAAPSAAAVPVADVVPRIAAR